MALSHTFKKIVTPVVIVGTIFGHTKLFCAGNIFKNNAGWGIAAAVPIATAIYCQFAKWNTEKQQSHELAMATQSTEREKILLERENKQRLYNATLHQQQKELHAQQEAEKKAQLDHNSHLLRQADPTLSEEYAQALCSTLPIDLLLAAARNRTLAEIIMTFHKIHEWQKINKEAKERLEALHTWNTTTRTTVQEATAAHQLLQQTVRHAHDAELSANRAAQHAIESKQKLRKTLEKMEQIARSVRDDKDATIEAEQKAKSYAHQAKEFAASTTHNVHAASKAAHDAKQAEHNAKKSAASTTHNVQAAAQAAQNAKQAEHNAKHSAELAVDVALQHPNHTPPAPVAASAPPYEEEPPSYEQAVQVPVHSKA